MDSILKENFTNNLRRYYVELYEKGEVGNIAEFAERCQMPLNTMCRYLLKGTFPKDPHRIRQIERCLGKEEGDLAVIRPKADFNPSKMSWGQPKQRGHKKAHHMAPSNDSMLAAEDDDNIIEQIVHLEQEELRAFIRRIRQETQKNIPRSLLKNCPTLFKLAYQYRIEGEADRKR